VAENVGVLEYIGSQWSGYGRPRHGLERRREAVREGTKNQEGRKEPEEGKKGRLIDARWSLVPGWDYHM
jgi:hypothetical protein